MKFKHGGYTLIQTEDINHHYMIFNPDRKLCMHAQYEGELFTQEQAEETIDFYLGFKLPDELQEESDDV